MGKLRFRAATDFGGRDCLMQTLISFPKTQVLRFMCTRSRMESTLESWIVKSIFRSLKRM